MAGVRSPNDISIDVIHGDLREGSRGFRRAAGSSKIISRGQEKQKGANDPGEQDLGRQRLHHNSVYSVITIPQT